MDIHDRHGLKSEANEALSAASCNPKKLILLHAGIAAAVLLALALIDFLLQKQIAGTGGLGGLGIRSVLETAQTLLQYLSTLALPFWNMGYTFAVLAMARRETAAPSILLEGFRKFGPVLRFFLLENGILLGLAILCFYPSMMIYLVTPLAGPLLTVLEPMIAGDDAAALMEDPSVLMGDSAVLAAMAPMLIIFCILYLVVAIPLLYRFRMADFALADAPKAGAFAAFRSSFRIMRGNRWALFRLDLSFWWFYVLEALAAALCYGDIVLEVLGFHLPMPMEVSYFLFYALGLVMQTALYLGAKNHVFVTYAKAYAALCQPAAPKPAPIPRNQPWNY